MSIFATTLTVLRLHGFGNLSSTTNRQIPVLYNNFARRLISKKTHPWPELKECEIEEKFIKGRGPGGQAVAKTNNCVQLKHIPTGIVVKNHATRSQSENRKLARENLIEQLDIYFNKENSFHSLQKKEEARKAQKAHGKAKRRLELKKALKLQGELNNKQMTTESEGFIVQRDAFSGLMIVTKNQSFHTAEEYDTKLAAAIPKWEAGDVRGFWAKISLEHTHLTTVFAKYGLDFHHAQPGYVMMNKWLSATEPCMIPEYAHNYLGVAGFVVNEKNQLLVIQEKFHPGTSPKWKLPGGHADKGEELMETAEREVFEETGIKAEFQGIITYRHQKNYKYGCSDFYFICLMRPVTEDQEIKKCDQEIGACKWMDLDEFHSNPDITDANRFFTQAYKEGVIQKNAIIKATLVDSFDKKFMHNVYRIENFIEKPDRDVDCDIDDQVLFQDT